MAIVFNCDWEDGSDILNTGGIHVWSSETDTGNKLSEAQNLAMWRRDFLYWNGISSAAGYLAKAFPSNYGASGYRFGLNCFSEGLSSGQQQGVMRIADTGFNPLFDAYLYDNGTYLLLYFQVYDTGGTGRNTTAVILSLDTNYQVVCKLQKNTAGGFWYTVYKEDGVTVHRSEIQLSTGYTTRNTNAYAMFAGAIFAAGVTTEHGFDIIQVIDSCAYPATRKDQTVEVLVKAQRSSAERGMQQYDIITIQPAGAPWGLADLRGKFVLCMKLDIPCGVDFASGRRCALCEHYGQTTCPIQKYQASDLANSKKRKYFIDYSSILSALTISEVENETGTLTLETVNFRLATARDEGNMIQESAIAEKI